jgi:hypothetical protein
MTAAAANYDGSVSPAPGLASARADVLFDAARTERFARVDRMFAVLMVVQWVAAIAIALLYSPYAWEGKLRTTNVHVYAAVFLGGGLTLFPVLLAMFRPGHWLTRHVIAASQMLWSALLIHLSGGRIETHFHVFGSLAFLAFYMDWRVVTTATVVVATDHFVRGLLWPESVYGISNPESWRFLEHAFWVVFEDVVLIWSCILGVREMRKAAERQAEMEIISESEQQKTAALEMVLAELGVSA